MKHWVAIRLHAHVAPSENMQIMRLDAQQARWNTFCLFQHFPGLLVS